MLSWNPHPRNTDGTFCRGGRLEGTYRNVEMVKNRVYQFNIADGPFGHSLEPGIFTGAWTGCTDSDGEPLFAHVDDRRIIRSARCASWFAPLHPNY